MRDLKFILKFSYRNLFRAPKRTLIMLLSLSLGTGFIIWDLNFANSGSKEVMKAFLNQYAGRYHITHSEYYNKKNTKLIDNYKTMSDAQIEDKSILSKSTRRVTAPVFVSGTKKTLGVLLTGIDVQKELQLSKLKDAITEGKNLSPHGQKDIILGRSLAEKLDIKLGDEVGIIGQALDGSVANDLMTVVGLLDFGGGELEDSLAFTQIATAQDLLVMAPDTYHQRVSFDMRSEDYPSLNGLAVTPWDEILPEVGVSVKFVDRFTWIVSCIIVLVISLGLSNTLMITFFEREKEFQTLNIIGAKTKWIAATLLVEVLLMGILGVFSGCLIGHLATTFFSYYPINIEIFTNGQPIIMGGMTIAPLVRFSPVYEYYWQVPILIFFFLSLTMIYPLVRVIQRSKNAI